ncbi:L-ascorbate metabolism protein UlaG (beta-lactamase superfamily) [Saccharothrix carnea]|uniref:L-ascorbate metabolism protein UlaG (Beta-lactamase superfamily) n=1 Tax=Saccharothrix carnea TaxID=1280637 RepID=A0A2P8II41_SACCR|nr:L-ascorbate metabolism protein UlaG (beta-lactamase superfamily) [Saccharothrix carnea]
MLIGSAAVAVAGAGLPGVAFASGRSGVSLRWLGVAGWELLFGGRRVLIDPYLSRLPVFDEEGGFIADYPLTVRKDLVDRHLGERPELVLATHGHYDHLLEIPYVVEKHGSRVIGTETHRHLLTAQEVPGDNVIVASGGEHLDFHGFTVQVFRSLHSQFGTYGYFAPGSLTAPPSRPRTISDLVEGGSLAYLVTVNGFSVLFLSGTANYVEREIVGLRPDVLVLGMSGHANVFDYTARALRATRPKLLIPSHHDDMVTQLDDPNLPPRGNPAAAAELTETARRIGLAARVLDPEVLRWYEL